MLKTGDQIKPIKFGKRLDIKFVTTDHSLIVPLVYFELGGKRFYFSINWRKDNPEKSGIVDPSASYYVQLENVTNMDNHDLKTIIDRGRYFSIFAPKMRTRARASTKKIFLSLPKRLNTAMA